MKRQRVALACRRCRALKAKCDGQQPSCGRCVGYGFTCEWTPRKRSAVERPPGYPNGEENSSISDSESTDLKGKACDRQGLERVAWNYETLIQSVRPSIKPDERATFDANVKRLREKVPRYLRNREPARESASRGNRRDSADSTYLGKASDIRFLDSFVDLMQVEDSQAVQTPKPKGQDKEDMDSPPVLTLDDPVQIPSRETGMRYLDMYFSTIQIAYPFLSKSLVLHDAQKLWTDHSRSIDDRDRLALLSTIFAIGAYYTSFPRTNADGKYLHLHFVFFEQAVALSNETIDTNSLTRVWLLLTQCFFLLAICRIDRCWNTLGLAIRVGQCIGLHVDTSSVGAAKRLKPVDQELRGRTWYSMYVLDRLLALQLGRPFAIHEGDFAVQLPSRDEKTAFGPDSLLQMQLHPQEHEASVKDDAGNAETIGSFKEASMMDYFLCVIQFSRILGQVVRELYHPTQVESSPEAMLTSISSLDASLASWKSGLPHHLRFDLGHTFEKSLAFKRQRNMLAVKVHHLRALMHRPFLCLPWLQRDNAAYMDLFQRHEERINRAERVCVFEAQQTAQLLHNIEDESSLIHDFPWWQMTSCLLCASSILLVADAFLQNQNSSSHLLPQDFGKDAENCLKVFDALNVDSEAARKAQATLRRITESRQAFTDESQNRPGNDISPAQKDGITEKSAEASLLKRDGSDSTSVFTLGPSDNIDDFGWQYQWPSEISDTMQWSSQFLNPAIDLSYDS